MVDFIHSFHDLVDRGHQEVGKVNLELEESVVSLPVEKMLEQFVLQKYTGLVSLQKLNVEASFSRTLAVNTDAGKTWSG